MHVFELDYPGSVIKFSEHADEIFMIIKEIENSFTESVVALNKFENSQNVDLIQYQRTYNEKLMLIKRNIGHHRCLDINSYFQDDKEGRNILWKSGIGPPQYLEAERFIYAKSFILGLDNICKLITKLTIHENAPNKINIEWKNISNSYPYLVEVRNSIHHIEDRILKVGKNKKRITLKPVDNNFIKSSNALIIGCLNGNKLGYTIADGSYSEIEISESTLAFFQGSIQNIINSFEWDGPKNISPM